MTNAIETRGLHWKSPKGPFAIRGLDLTVPGGSIYGFLGPNGSGKTSTIRLLMGMNRPASGEISVLGGRGPGDLPDVLARTGYVPERSHLYPALTVSEAIRFHGAFYRHWDAEWAEEMRQRFRLNPETRIARLSKGELGKLLILLALAPRPELLILDEPTDGLDPVVRRDVLSTLMDFVSETGATVFISSHLIHELERICDWVGILDDGRMVAEMPMEVFKNEIKRLRVVDAPAELSPELPFQLLGRHAGEGIAAGEIWIVRGWRDEMTGAITEAGASVREVVHLDLEEGFVELLKAARPGVWAVGNEAESQPRAEGAVTAPGGVGASGASNREGRA